MTDLSGIDDESADLVYSGQSIEHGHALPACRAYNSEKGAYASENVDRPALDKRAQAERSMIGGEPR